MCILLICVKFVRRAIPHGETVAVWFQIVDYNVREGEGFEI